MSTSNRPVTYSDREELIHAMTVFRADTCVSPTLIALYDTLLASELRAYVEARERSQRTMETAIEARRASESAAGDFDRDLRNFAATVRDPEGRARPREVAELLGGTLPSKLARKRHREKVQRTRGLMDRLSARTGLRYEAEQAAALERSAKALDLAVAADERARRWQRSDALALAQARANFDRAYVRLLAAARVLLDESTFASIFPRFGRPSADLPSAGPTGRATELPPAPTVEVPA